MLVVHGVADLGILTDKGFRRHVDPHGKNDGEGCRCRERDGAGKRAVCVSGCIRRCADEPLPRQMRVQRVVEMQGGIKVRVKHELVNQCLAIENRDGRGSRFEDGGRQVTSLTYRDWLIGEDGSRGQLPPQSKLVPPGVVEGLRRLGTPKKTPRTTKRPPAAQAQRPHLASARVRHSEYMAKSKWG